MVQYLIKLVYQRGEIVYSKGQPSSHMYIVLKGDFELFVDH